MARTLILPLALTVTWAAAPPAAAHTDLHARDRAPQLARIPGQPGGTATDHPTHEDS
ncbi:hypothetical protein [Streptomyces sp. NPDC056891]|uniref:hypothetical protein n=1 Tax=unclassified Streptomyces TaxID=2593676 RepID=UPI0036776940